jgi:heat-inducible transcriptional repressor
MKLDARTERILKSLVQLYIHDGHPVGSRTLARQSSLSISAATIRNVMADLEELGLISSPHTSAGRVPTSQGYRLFVDSLLSVNSLNQETLSQMQGALNEEADPETLLAHATELLSDITHFAGVVLLPGQNMSRFRQIEFLSLARNRVLAILVTDDGRVQNRVISTDREYTASELVESANYFNDLYSGSTLSAVRKRLVDDMRVESDEMHKITQTALKMASKLFEEEDSDHGDVVLSGEENLLSVPELCQIEKLQKLFTTLRAKQDLLDLLDRSMRVSGISIFIGEESGYSALDDCSIVAAPYEANGEIIGTLGVIGPTRMAYGDVISVVDVTAKLLSGALSGTRTGGLNQ